MVHSSGAAGNVKDAIIDFVAGSLGGIGLVYVGQPLDTVKVKMQTFPQLYKGMWNCFMTTLRREGIVRGLYAGTIPAVVANVAENSVLFAGYGACQKLMMKVTNSKTPEELSIFSNASAGCLAAFFSSFTLCPTELIKCRLQADKELANTTGARHTVKSPFSVTKDILRRDGFPGLFRGLSPTLVREMPGYFFFFGGYEAAREFLRVPGQSKDDIGPFKTMIAGAVGGCILWVVIFPADVAKSRIQISQADMVFTKLVVDIVRREGFTALYSGLMPTLVRTVPATATLFLVYENSKKFMHYCLE